MYKEMYIHIVRRSKIFIWSSCKYFNIFLL